MKLRNSRDFKLLIAGNAGMAAFLGAFLLTTPLTAINFNIIISSSTSLLAFILGDFVALRYVRLQIQVQNALGGRTMEETVARINKTLDEAEKFANSPEIALLTQILVKKAVGGEKIGNK